MRIYVVYLPILRADLESTVPAAMTRLPDKRVTFFWDGKGELGQSYARILKLPESQPAWDVYFVFKRGAEWRNESPTPDYWMHQLRGQPSERYLNGEKLTAETNKLLLMKKVTTN